jgi:RuvB-like protein 2
MLIISTTPYKEQEIQQILSIRCEEEDVDITEEALELLTTIGLEASLRYAINLISTSVLVSTRRKSTQVDVEDVRRV